MDISEFKGRPMVHASALQPDSHLAPSDVAELNLEAAAGFENAPTKPETELKTKKPLSFHMAFLALNLMVLIVSLDATALAVAIPVPSSTY